MPARSQSARYIVITLARASTEREQSKGRKRERGLEKDGANRMITSLCKILGSSCHEKGEISCFGLHYKRRAMQVPYPLNSDVTVQQDPAPFSASLSSLLLLVRLVLLRGRVPWRCDRSVRSDTARVAHRELLLVGRFQDL